MKAKWILDLQIYSVQINPEFVEFRQLIPTILRFEIIKAHATFNDLNTFTTMLNGEQNGGLLNYFTETVICLGKLPGRLLSLGLVRLLSVNNSRHRRRLSLSWR